MSLKYYQHCILQSIIWLAWFLDCSYEVNCFPGSLCFRADCVSSVLLGCTGSPATASNAAYASPQAFYRIQDNITYICDQGYGLTSGIPVVKCRADGTWSPPNFVCTRESYGNFNYSVYIVTMDDDVSYPRDNMSSRKYGNHLCFQDDWFWKNSRKNQVVCGFQWLV